MKWSCKISTHHLHMVARNSVLVSFCLTINLAVKLCGLDYYHREPNNSGRKTKTLNSKGLWRDKAFWMQQSYCLSGFVYATFNLQGLLWRTPWTTVRLSISGYWRQFTDYRFHTLSPHRGLTVFRLGNQFAPKMMIRMRE